MEIWGKSIQLLLLAYVSLIDAQYEKWRDDLLCQTSCKDENHVNRLQSGIDPYDDCCACKSIPSWENCSKPCTILLDIEFVSTLGKSLLISENPVQLSSLYRIEFKHQDVQFFPSNLCQWDSNKRLHNLYGQQFIEITQFYELIVKIDLSHNELTELIDLNCLKRLDTLDLSYNTITSLSNTSLSNLTHLRVLYLQHNMIKQTDAGIIASPMLRLQEVDISHNQLEKMDVTNFFSLHPFCYIDYNENNIEKIVNELDFKLNVSKSYGPGYVNIQNNAFKTFPDFTELFHLKSLADLGNLMNFGFDFRGVPIICDCNLEPFMALAQDIIENLWRYYFDVTCDGPENLKGKSIATFIDDIQLDHLICNRTETRECYPCHCIDQPSKNTVFVNCSGKGLTDLPAFLPESKFSGTYNLDLSNNKITILKTKPYLSSVSHLSLANNVLTQIEPEAALLLENITVLNLANNKKLTELPPVLQYTNNSKIIMQNLTIDCDCNSAWIQRWRGLYHGNETSTFECRVPEYGVMPPDQFTEDLLDCDPVSNMMIILSALLAAAVFILIIAGLVSYWLRYEILILLIRMKQASKYMVCPILQYDAYISYDDDNDELRKWANMTLVSFLENSGYKIFVPLRDLKYGDVRDLNTIEILNKTKNFLLILSESYMDKTQTSWMDHEWKYGWHMFKTNRNKNIVMINFDQCLTSDATSPQMKAFLRVGGVVDFSNLDRNILNQIASKLGPPSCQLKQPYPPERNQKAKVAPWHLFQAQNNRTIQEQNLNMIRSKGIDNNSNQRYMNQHKAKTLIKVKEKPASDHEEQKNELWATMNCKTDESSNSNNTVTVRPTIDTENTLTDIDVKMLVSEKQRPTNGIYKYWKAEAS